MLGESWLLSVPVAVCTPERLTHRPLQAGHSSEVSTKVGGRVDWRQKVNDFNIVVSGTDATARDYESVPQVKDAVITADTHINGELPDAATRRHMALKSQHRKRSAVGEFYPPDGLQLMIQFDRRPRSPRGRWRGWSRLRHSRRAVVASLSTAPQSLSFGVDSVLHRCKRCSLQLVPSQESE